MVLIQQADLAAETYAGAPWHRTVYFDLSIRLHKGSEFPCLFSQNAFARELLLFHFVETGQPASMKDLSRALQRYVDLSRGWDGKVSTACPLIVAFSKETIQADNVENYHAFAWSVLQCLHEQDRAPWPETVATDPHQPFWSMCFGGMQIFVNVSNSAHVARKSRNLGEHLLFVVNPRERFDIVAGNTPEGRGVRRRIRARIERYDGMAHCPQLGSYEAGEIEWWQYGIIEENGERTDRCPFKFSGKKVLP